MPVSFEGGDDAPFVAEVFEDSLDSLIGVSNVVFLHIIDVGWVDFVLYQAVDGDSIDVLLFPLLLLLNFVFRVEFCLVDKGDAVGESVWVSGGVSMRLVVVVSLPVID